MNGIHDMGGMQGMGPIQYEKDEPVFHADWERRLLAINAAMQATGKIGGGPRLAGERVSALDYLRMSYYERWFTGFIDRIVTAGLVTSAEIASGRPAQGSAKAVPALPAAEAAAYPLKTPQASRNVPVAARFQLSQQVRARNINPVTHTRLPRYARGKPGMIDRDHGVFAFPDTNVLGLGEKPQHVYSVRFAARDLWGEQAASQDAVYLDLWEDYLEPA
jgi:nitrile hydratase subunit beta